MTRIRFCAAALFAGFLALTPTMSRAYADAPPEIVDAYQQMDSTVDQRDPESLLKFYTWNAIFLTPTGAPVSRAQIADNLRSAVRASQSIDSNTTIDDAEAGTDGVTATVTQKVVYTEIDPGSQILYTTFATTQMRDHWVQVGGGWRINRSRVISASRTTNKPWEPPVAPAVVIAPKPVAKPMAQPEDKLVAVKAMAKPVKSHKAMPGPKKPMMKMAK
jgi:ketosteroid isomerase-like protein